MKNTTIHSGFRLFALAGALCGLIAISTATLVPAANALSPSGLKIFVVDVDPDQGTITIFGQGFDVIQDTTVTLGEFGALDILFENSDTIVADLPQDIVPGNYLLEVETNGGSSGQDESDLTYGTVGPEGPAGPEGPEGPAGPQGPEVVQNTTSPRPAPITRLQPPFRMRSVRRAGPATPVGHT